MKTDIDGETKIITFLPVAGGVGSSTMAAACSYNIAARGKRVLYLNLEQLEHRAFSLTEKELLI